MHGAPRGIDVQAKQVQRSTRRDGVVLDISEKMENSGSISTYELVQGSILPCPWPRPCLGA